MAPRKKNKDENKLPENERLRLEQHVKDFLDSDEQEREFEGMEKASRKYLHTFAQRLGLKSRSHNVKVDGKVSRVLNLMRAQRKGNALERRQLQLPHSVCQSLQSIVPALRAQLLNAEKQLSSLPRKRSQQQQQRASSQAAFMTALGPRMVPPRANRISKELFREKQELPIQQFEEQIMNLLHHHSVFIINGETGSGKTTQVPQFILNHATRHNMPCRIIVTQPRRVAAISIAQRVAKERAETLGEAVGYQIRLESRVSKHTNLIYTTSGCLLRAIMSDMDDLFQKVTHLIIDEIHERDKNTDFTLITVKEQLQKHKDVKLILMSATMDIDLLSNYFEGCPVLNVPGQSYNIKLYYLEDILFYTGYRTGLMEKYLRSLPENGSMQQQLAPIQLLNNSSRAAPLLDEYLQETLNLLLEQCCAPNNLKDEELCEIFDQILYFIDSEGMPVDAGHSETGITPLMAACMCNLPHYVEIFLERQAEVQLNDKYGRDAFAYALKHADGVCYGLLCNVQRICEMQQMQKNLSLEDIEKQRLMYAYQQQFNEENDVDHYLILSLIERLYRGEYPGAIMVFLPGYIDIVQQRDLISDTLPVGTYKLCILHGHMDAQDQTEALKRHSVRKIILSTNIGQTSITIPDLVFVIDAGKVKMNAYDVMTESSHLQSVWISKADACQRAGRAGRTQNGVCYRLYSQAKYNSMLKFSLPEFMRIPLTEICLYAKTLAPSCNVETYMKRALNPPNALSVQNAIRKLKLLGVFDEQECVTELGKHLVELPVDVQLGKCLLYAIFLRCLHPIMTIVAFHTVKDPFVLPSDRNAQGQASFLRKQFAGNSWSDHMGILNLYKSYANMRGHKSKMEFCIKNYLSQSAMDMFCATRKLIADAVQHKYNLNAGVTQYNNDWNLVRFCLAAGLYPNVAVVDRTKCSISTCAKAQLIMQRTSSLNPPGKKQLKEFVNELPHDWIIYYEKCRVARMCAINMNTIVHPLLILLQCGRDCVLEGDTPTDSDEEPDDAADELDVAEADNASVNQLMNALKKCALNGNGQDIDKIVTISLDNWIRFGIKSEDAQSVLMLRELLSRQFDLFLNGIFLQPVSAADLLQRVLHKLDAHGVAMNALSGQLKLGSSR